MNQLAHGSVGERPWGCVLAGFAKRRLNGELDVGNDKQQVRAVLRDGAIVAATSPLAADSAARIGMTLNMVTSTQVAELSRRLAAAPDRDDVDVIAEAIRLAPELAQRLRRRVIALRAARTFGLDGAPYVLDDRVRVPVTHGGDVDIRAVIYLGARTHLGNDQLAGVVDWLGSTVAFTQELLDDLPQFGFGELEMPLVDVLRRGDPFSVLLAGRSEAERRLAYAVMYSLLVWTRPDVVAPQPDSQDLGGLSVSFRKRPTSLPPDGIPSMTSRVTRELTRPPSRPTPTPTGSPTPAPTPTPTPAPRSTISPVQTPPLSRTTTPPMPRTMTPDSRSPSAAGTTPPPTPTPTPTPSQRTTGSNTVPPGRATGSNPTVPPLTPPQRATTTGNHTALPAQRATTTGNHTALPAQRATTTGNHTALPASPSPSPASVPMDDKRPPTTPPALAPTPPAGRTGPTTASQLIARATGRYAAVPASATGSSPGLGSAAPGSTEPPPLSPEQTRAEAEAARLRGEMALRREQLPQAIEEFQTATKLDPKNGAYGALLAWAQFCAASDKAAIASDTRRALARAIMGTTEPVARLYLGRVERMLGREREALQHFRDVLDHHPGHAEATSEARVLEGRLANKSSGGFGKPKR